MTTTETLLIQADEMARRTFEQPTEETVMRLFHRLCLEVGYTRPSGEAVH